MTNPFCECPVSGWCKRHQMTKGAERHKRCQGTASSRDCGLAYWNAWEQGRLGATAPVSPQLNPEGFCGEPVTIRSNIGTLLHEIIKRETGVDIPCPVCQEKITSLNTMTKESAGKVRDAVVTDIVARSTENAQKVWQRFAIGVDSILGLGLLHKKVGSWFDEAVVGAEETPGKKEKPAVRPVAAAVGKPSRPLITPRNLPTTEQMQLFRRSQQAKPGSRPFVSPPLFNLVFHLWPVRGAWEWHADRLRDLIPLCTGKVIIGVATDDSTATLDEVKDRIGSCSGRVDHWIISENIAGTGNITDRGKPFGELLTTIPAFDMLADTGDSITIYGHGKGARTHTRTSPAVRLWTEMMYETVSFNLFDTFRLMEEGYSVVGSFRTFGFKPLHPKHSWHYSGTFYNFRTQDLLCDGKGKPQQLRYGGTEAWPGDHVKATHAACIFEDNSPWLRQYDLGLMQNVIPKHLLWQSAWYEGVEMEQHHREYQWLVQKLKAHKVERLLVIGSRHGGLEYHLRRDVAKIHILSVDIDPLKDNREQNLIIGNSHDVDTQEVIRAGGPFDAVFIDGDHSELGARLDWEFAQTLNPRVVFFHDHTDAVYHARCGCFVDRVWAEILAAASRKGWRTDEKVVGCGWGGIGAVAL